MNVYEKSKGLILIEDNKILAMLLKKMCEDVGVTVYHAEDGDSAKEMLVSKAGRYHVVLSDHDFPGSNGTELLRYFNGLPNARDILDRGSYIVYTGNEKVLKEASLRDDCILIDKYKEDGRIHDTGSILLAVDNALGLEGRLADRSGLN